jgi:hypothetical protein
MMTINTMELYNIKSIIRIMKVHSVSTRNKLKCTLKIGGHTSWYDRTYSKKLKTAILTSR